MTDIIIAGGGPAGLTAAVYALRAGKSAAVFECEAFGGQIAVSPEVENYPAILKISGAEFADRLTEQVRLLGGELRAERIERIDTDLRKVSAVTGEYAYKALIVAVGTAHRRLGAVNEDKYTGRGVSYCAVCDGAFFRNRTAAVIGGGNTALTEAIYLSDICANVTVIHRRSEFRADAKITDELKRRRNIDLILESEVISFDGKDVLEGITVRSLKNGDEKRISTDGAFIAAGSVPRSELYEGILDTDEAGYIKADESCRTSADGVFAAGDCRTKSVRQLTTAAADGTAAALAACEYIDRNK